MWNISDKHLGAGLVVDTNLFVLLLVGRHDLTKLEKFRATRKYNRGAFRLLSTLVSLFARVWATTNIVTEVDNLSRQVDKTEWAGVSASFARLIGDLNEEAFPSKQLIEHPAHPSIGVTDCSIMELAIRNVLVATDDLPLTIQLERRGLGVINLSRYLAS